MNYEDTSASQAIGLDIGTSRIVLARRKGHDYDYQSQLNAFINLPFSKMTESALRKQSIPFLTRDSDIIVHGDESEKFADVLKAETRRPMTGGMLNPAESDSPVVIQKIVELLLAGNGHREGMLYFSVPAPPLGGDENLTYHEATLRHMLGEFGYTVKSINEGLAVVYGEMENSNYTGIGISCGGGLCNVCFAYLSVPVLSFSIPKAGDFIDSSAAAVAGELATRIRIAKESAFHLNGHPREKLHQALGVYYDDMIQTLVNGMKETFEKSRSLPKLNRPVPLVLSGGTALPKGFPDRFRKILEASEFSIKLSEIRLAPEPLCSTAKGALVAALSEL